MAAIAQDNSLNSLANLLQGINSLAGSTTTQSTSISGDAQKALLTQILQGTQGLASVASGQKAAGMYNSTVNTQLINDLLARSTAEVAAQNKTTTTNTQSNLTKGNNLSKIALAIGGKALLGKGQDLLKSLLTGTTGGDANSMVQALAGGGTLASPSASSEALLSQIAGGDMSGVTANVLNGAQLDNSVLNGVSGSAGSVPLDTNALFTTLGTASAADGLTTAGGQSIANLGGGTLSTALNSGDSGLSTLMGSGYSGLLDTGASSAASGFADSAASDLASNSASALAGDASSAVPYVGPLISAGVKGAQGDTLGAVGTGVGAAVGSVIPGLGTALGATIGGFIGSNAGSWSDVKDSMTDPQAIAFGVPGLGQLSDKLTGAVTDPSSLPGISSVLGGMGGFGSAIGDIMDAPGSIVGSIVGGVGDAIGDIFGGIGDFFGGLF